MGITAKDLAEGILSVCIGDEGTLAGDLHQTREGFLKEVDEHAALAELFMMRVAVAAYFIQHSLVSEVQKEARAAVGQRLHSMLTNSTDIRLRNDPNKAVDEINRRTVAYSAAIETHHHLGAPWNVGKTFAKFCRPEHEMDSDAITVGATEFVAAAINVVEYLKVRKSMNGGEIIEFSGE